MKRPVVWFGLALVFGEILGFMPIWFGLSVWMAVIGICVWTGRKRKHILESVCFLVLPVFCLLGGLRIQHVQQEEETIVKQVDTAPKTYEGVVTEIEIKEDVKVLYVKCEGFFDRFNGLHRGKFTYKIRCRVPLYSETIVSKVGLYDKVRVSGKVSLFDKATNPGCYDAYEVNRLERIFYQIKSCRVDKIMRKAPALIKALERLRLRMNTVIQNSLNAELAGILSAMVTGDKSGMPVEINRLYQSQGIAHIMAISGLHVTMAGMGLYKLLRRLFVPQPLGRVLSLAAVFAYVSMCGFSVSSIRAVVMFIAVLGGEIIGRSSDGATAVGAAGIFILIREPLALFSFGFLMSFGCVLGLLIMEQLNGKLAGVYITAVTLPVLSWFQYEVPVYSILLNMTVVPAMGILFPMGLLGSLLGCIWLPLGRLLCVGAGVILKLYEYLCLITEKLPLSVVVTGRPSVLKCLIIYSGLILFFCFSWVIVVLRSGSGLVKIIRWCCLLVYMLLFVHMPPQCFEVIFVDVGQGDCSILRTEEGTVFMIDGGSSSENEIGRYTIQKVLKYYGIDAVDYMLLSHMDADHINGAVWMMDNGWRIGQLVLPEIICDIDTRNDILRCAEIKNIPVSVLCAGDQVTLPGVSVQCLHPPSALKTTSDNAASMVLKVTCGQCNFWFTGDVEGEGEQALMAYIRGTQESLVSKESIDVLKVAHHGSKNSTSEEFLNLIRPKYAVISCGRENSYGHPHKELMARLAAIHCETAVTAYHGAVLVRCDGRKIKMYGT